MDHLRHFSTAQPRASLSHAHAPHHTLPQPQPPPQPPPLPNPSHPHHPYAPRPAPNHLQHSHLQQHLPPTQPISEIERDRSKRLKMNGRNPSTEGFYGHSASHQSSHPPPLPPPPPPHHAGIASSQHYGESSRSPEFDRMNGPGSGYRPGPPPLQSLQQQPTTSRHEPIPPNGAAINPTSNRGSPVFLPPHRTSTPDNHGHRRTPSYHNSPHIARGPPQDPVMSQSHQQHPPPPPPPQTSSQSTQHHHHSQQQQHIRGMPPPSSPHRTSLSHPQSAQPLRPPPPPPPSLPTLHQHQPAGPPPSGFSQGSGIPSTRELPLPHRPSMSISSMLDGGPLPPPTPSSGRQPDMSPLKAPFTPEFATIDRSRESTSPSSATTSIQGLPGPKQSRITPPEPVYRAHHQLQHLSNADREAPYGMPSFGQRSAPPPPPPPPPRPQSQPHGLPGVRDDGPPRHIRSGSFSDREMYGERQLEWQRERERDRQQGILREREARERERERQLLEQEQREREEMEREREREQRERERMREQREREQRERDREREQRERDRDRDRDRDRFNERERFGGSHSASSLFGRERMELQNPQTSSSHPPYGMTITSRFPITGSQNGIQQSPAPPSASISTSTTMSLPQTSTAGSQGFGSSHSQLSGSATTPRESYQQPFSGYSVTMPPSPFSISPSLPLPTVGDDARDRDARPQRFKPPSREVSSGGRDEPLRAEDALKQRGLNRPLSSLMADGKERVGKDRDGIVRDKDGIMRLTDSALAYHSPPRRSAGLGLGWNDLSKDVLEKEREGRDKVGMGMGMMGGMGMKRNLEDDDNSSKAEKKKRHHHHHQHPHHLNHHHHHYDEQPSTIGLEAPKVSASARSRSPLHTHHHHHPHPHTHIHHHHNPPLPASQPGTSTNQSLSKIATTLLIDSSKVLASLESKPRNYLGSTVYLPTPTPKEGYSVTQPLLPRFEGRENSIFQVRIPKRFLSDTHRRDVTRRRCVWGTEVYTDDSDILAVLIHTGRIPGYIPEDVDPTLLKETGRKIILKGSISASTSPTTPAPGKWKINGTAKKTEEKRPTIPPGKDLLVNLLILPRLERYTGSVKNALKSRSWNTIHDGMSYSIWDMEWVEAGEAESRGGGSKKRRLDEREWVRRWGELPPSRGGMGKQGGWNKGRWNPTETQNGKSNGEVAGVGA